MGTDLLKQTARKRNRELREAVELAATCILDVHLPVGRPGAAQGGETRVRQDIWPASALTPGGRLRQGARQLATFWTTTEAIDGATEVGPPDQAEREVLTWCAEMGLTHARIVLNSDFANASPAEPIRFYGIAAQPKRRRRRAASPAKGS